MITYLAFWGAQWVHRLAVFQYISVRAIGGLLTALLVSWVWGDWFLQASQRHFRSKVREFTPERHKQKNNIPTMGGLFIVGNAIVSTLLWCHLSDVYVWLMLSVLVSFGAIGACDDWYKISYNSGLPARAKWIMQLIAAVLFVVVWLWVTGYPTFCVFPVFKSLQPDFGLLFVPWAMFVLVAMSNAVNLTDGLDGLAISCVTPCFVTFAAISYCAGHWYCAQYLHIPFAATGELAVIGAVLVGACLGFLWYNVYPASLFMGDVGSLALGAALAAMALMTKQELLLPLAGGLFVIETVSVIVQVVGYKLWGTRLFKMAPLHHHFELLGWHEPEITTRFVIITIALCLLTLVLLKVR